MAGYGKKFQTTINFQLKMILPTNLSMVNFVASIYGMSQNGRKCQLLGHSSGFKRTYDC